MIRRVQLSISVLSFSSSSLLFISLYLFVFDYLRLHDVVRATQKRQEI